MTKPDEYSPLMMLAKQSLEDLSRLSKLNVGIVRAIREGDPASSDPMQQIVRKLKAIHAGTTSLDALKLPTSYDELKEWLADFEVNVRDKDSRLRRLIDPLGLLDAVARPSETTTNLDASMPALQQGIRLEKIDNEAFGKFTVKNQRPTTVRYRFAFSPSDIGPGKVKTTFDPKEVELLPLQSQAIALTIEFMEPEYIKTLSNRTIEFRVDVRESIGGEETDLFPSTIWVKVQLGS